MSVDLKYKRYAEKIRIFNGLKADEVYEIVRGGRMVDFAKGRTIFHEGMLGSNLFVVFSGEVEIHRRAKVIGTCVVGDCFGEMSVLNQRPRNATALAVRDTTVFTLDEEQINALLLKEVSSRLLLNVIHVLSERLEDANAKISTMNTQGS